MRYFYIKVMAMLLFASLCCTFEKATAEQVEVVPADRVPKEEQEAPLISEKELKKAYYDAMKRYQQALSAKWPNPETSTNSKWVDYTDDNRHKRVIDFSQNRIMITTPFLYRGERIDYPTMKQVVKLQFTNLLGLTLADAIENNPVDREMASLLRLDSEEGQLNSQVILPELFSQDLPSQQEINTFVDRIFPNAYIKQNTVAAANSRVTLERRATYVIDLPASSVRKRAARYKPEVFQHASNYDLPPDLLFAIIHTESHFNPLARSHIPAYGLMQIVPYTAGKDASKVLYQKPKILSPRYLYNPERNIRIGTVYFNLLYFKYLSGITNPKTRLYCAIASYNAGTTSVMRALTGQGTITRAIDRINQMTDDQVYNRLIRNLPARESRDYLRRVIKRQSLYAKI